jgi:hypothetical protein
MDRVVAATNIQHIARLIDEGGTEMPEHVLRHFLYLDSMMVEEFLAGVQGASYDREDIEESEDKENSGNAEVDLKVIGGGGKGTRRKGTRISRRAQLTDPAKFQRLYALLEEDQTFQYYATMDADSWDSIHRASMLELEVTISLSTLSGLAAAIQNFDQLDQIFAPLVGKSLWGEHNLDTTNLVKMLCNAVQAQEAMKGIPVVMTLIGTPEYRFLAHLNPKALREEKQRLTGEVSVFCKVQRKLGENERFSPSSPLQLLDGLPLTREDKYKLAEEERIRDMDDVVESPAAIVIPVAIYR